MREAGWPSMRMDARVRFEHAEDAFEQDGFSGAGAADHHETLALRDLEGDAVEDALAVERLAQIDHLDLREHQKNASVRT